jgi:hypothetical protein
MHGLPSVLLPFAPWVLAGLAMISVSLFLRFGRKGMANRLAEIYPRKEPAPGTRFRRERAVIGRGYFSMARVKIGADAERLHVYVMNSFQGVDSFSVPLDEIVARPDRYPWMVLSPDTIRLHLARAPEAVLMVFPGNLRRLAEASGGRLRIEGPAAPAARAAPAATGRH